MILPSDISASSLFGYKVQYSAHVPFREVIFFKDERWILLTIPTLAWLLSENNLLSELDNLETLLVREAHRRFDRVKELLSHA
jgi:hypothetical protein